MKLWQKNYDTHELIERFTVGNDYILDKQLIKFDCALSIAHAEVLCKIGILTTEEVIALGAELREIAKTAALGNFIIERSSEDGHTAIEKVLTQKLGELGKKIHTGRSRNDQVATAMRLYEKDQVFNIAQALRASVDKIMSFAKTHEFVPMPGRTHLQSGMPSSVGLWAMSLVSQLLDDAYILSSVLELCDRSPLGSAASYGVPLDLDRELSAHLLGFSGPFVNVLAAQHSRGKIETLIADSCDNILLTISKYAQDLILFSLPEFGYFTLPNELTSGSSIMPQKKNPDGLELLRSKSGLVSGYAQQIKNIIRSSPSGYNRDAQDTKEATMKVLEITHVSILVLELTFEKLVVNEENLRAGFTPDIYATDYALDLVKKGMPFRDAYKKVGLELDKLTNMDPVELLKARTSIGAPGNLQIEEFEKQTRSLFGLFSHKQEIHQTALDKLLS